MLKPTNSPLTPQSVQAVAVMVALTVGAVLGSLAYDGVLMALRGHTATISHGMAGIGQLYPWFPWVWTCGLIAVVLFLAWHFWGWKCFA